MTVPFLLLVRSFEVFSLLNLIAQKDDAYSPYYPGDEYVDWIGASIYTYGTRFPWSDNSVATPGKFLASLNDRNFYQTYAAAKNKSFAISETAASFHVNTPLGAGVGELEVKRSWWRQYITNETFLSEYKQLRLVCLFEFQKFEESKTFLVIFCTKASVLTLVMN